MEYDDIIKILLSPNNERFVLDGFMCSEIVCDKRDTGFYDVVFMYAKQFNSDVAFAPFSKIVLDVETEKVIEYIEYESDEVSSVNIYDDSLVNVATEKYRTLYPKFKEVFRKTELTQNDIELICEIWECMRIFMNDDFLKIYRAMALSMFEFIENIIER